MSRSIRVNAGKKSVALPDGRIYDGQVDVTLSDAQFQALGPTVFTSGLLTDMGAVADPATDASFATDAALASEASRATASEADIKDGFTATGEIVAPDFKVSGLPGATTSSRYVGATTGGPPVTGTFLVNDWIITPVGVLICIVAGSPGTWQPAGPGFELAIDKAVANETRTGSVANASMNDQVQISFPCPASAFIVEGWAFNGSVATAGGRGQLTLASPDLVNIYSIDTVTSAAAGDVDRLDVQTRLTAADLGVAVGATVTFELFKKVFNSAHTFTITATGLTPIVLRAVTVL